MVFWYDNLSIGDRVIIRNPASSEKFQDDFKGGFIGDIYEKQLNNRYIVCNNYECRRNVSVDDLKKKDDFLFGSKCGTMNDPCYNIRDRVLYKNKPSIILNWNRNDNYKIKSYDNVSQKYEIFENVKESEIRYYGKDLNEIEYEDKNPNIFSVLGSIFQGITEAKQRENKKLENNERDTDNTNQNENKKNEEVNKDDKKVQKMEVFEGKITG